MVHFVGAGPGAVDLITVRGREMLSEADVIIYAGSLVNPELLTYAKSGAKILNSATMTLEDVIEEMADAEACGLTTVRLHTGDPSLYGAIREQIDLLKERGIAYDVCPGVTAAFGAAASLGIEYTLPGVSQSLLLTRAEGRTPVPDRESLSACAALHCSLVLYLSSTLADKVREELLAGGYEADTPVAVVYKATWEDELTLRSTVATFPEEMKRAGIDHTALIMVGDCLGETYERSRLYDPSFHTAYRGVKKEGSLGFSRVSVIVTSVGGAGLLPRIEKALDNPYYGDGTKAPEIRKRILAHDAEGYRPGDTLASVTEEAFSDSDAVLFVSAAGIAVRAIAPYLSHKSVDPAVLTIDEQGRFVISLLSGHLGGANALAEALGTDLLSQPVVTTATDLAGRFSVDTYARERGLIVSDFDKAKKLSVRALAGEEIREGTNFVVTNRLDNANSVLALIPKNIICGIGCRKNTDEMRIASALNSAFAAAGVDRRALRMITSIDLKKEEAGIVKCAETCGVPYRTYDADCLRRVTDHKSASDFVKETTGVDSVCEQSALYAASELETPYHLLLEKTVYEGVTIALVELED